MRILNTHISSLFALILCLSGMAMLSPANAQIVAMVNDDPITSYDIAQRQRWLARTHNFGENIKAILTSEATKKKFQQMMIAANPQSQAEAQQAAERIKKQLIEDVKHRVLNDGGGSSRKAALDAIIEDRLKLQAAKELKVTVTDKEIEETIGARTGGSGEGKVDLTDFYKQFEADGISKKTIFEIFRSQLAWREAIKRQYGPRLQSVWAAIPADVTKTNDTDFVFEVQVLKVPVTTPTDDKAVSKRIIEAESVKERFTSCAELPKQAKLVSGATVKLLDKVKLASFPKDVQPLILKAGEGQMTPPLLVGDTVESYAVCKKAIATEAAAGKKAAKEAKEAKPDLRMQEWDRVSRRYYEEIKQKASIDYRDTTVR